MKTFVAVLSALILSILVGVTGNTVFDLNPLIVGGASFVASCVLPGKAGIAYNVLFAAPGGIGTAFNSGGFRGLPQWLMWNDAGNPITDLQVETKEDGVIINYLAAGLAAVNGFCAVGAMPANQVCLRLANGFLPDRNCTITGHTAAAGVINFNINSDCMGTNPFLYSNAAIVAANPTMFTDFTAVFIPAMAAGDTAEVNYRLKNGSYYRQVYNIEELAALSINYNDAAGIIINNMNARIKDVTVFCAALHPAYVIRIKGNMTQ